MMPPEEQILTYTKPTTSRINSIVAVCLVASAAIASLCCVALRSNGYSYLFSASSFGVEDGSRIRRSSSISPRKLHSTMATAATNESNPASSSSSTARTLADSPFRFDLKHAVCPGLEPVYNVDTPEACEAKCAEDLDCDVWQWCPAYDDPAKGKSCYTYESEWTWGDYVRCYKTTAKSLQGKICKPDIYVRWIGGTKTASRIPQRTHPVATKRGFSGFLKGQTETGELIDPCEDAKALG